MKIDIFSDMVCPWCRIGKQNLMQALEQREDQQPVNIRYRAFMLDPTVPEEGLPYQETMARKFGDDSRMEQIVGHVCRVGEACGVPFLFDRIERMPNTRKAHQLAKIVPDELQIALVDAVMKAYFEEGKDIGDPGVLAALAEGIGFDGDIVRLRLANGDGLAEVEEDLEFARRARIEGVPYFVFNDRFALSGAQPVEAFLQAFARVNNLG